MIGGTGPSGIPIVLRLVANGHDVTILHRGNHERPETPPDLAHIHADPYDEASIGEALTGTSWDVIVAMYGRLRMIARITSGLCSHFVSVGGVPAYRGWTDAWQYDPPGMPVPVREDADLVDDPVIDEKGYRIVRTEQAVFKAHPGAAHFRYPYLSTGGGGSLSPMMASPFTTTATPKTAQRLSCVASSSVTSRPAWCSTWGTRRCSPYARWSNSAPGSSVPTLKSCRCPTTWRCLHGRCSPSRSQLTGCSI